MSDIDTLLRQTMSAPVPHLSPDFERALLRKLHPKPFPLHGRILLTIYGVTSAVTSIVVMRNQGLGWAFIAAMTIVPLIMFDLSRRLVNKKRARVFRPSPEV